MRVKLVCEHCFNEFEREKKEHTRNTKKGRKVYCGRRCTALANPVLSYRAKNPDLSILRKGKVIDLLSPFRQHLLNIRRHSKKTNRVIEITLEDLRELWIKQEGRCPYTGWNLVNYTTCACNLKFTPDRASVDRIDSSKGYTKDNIQFVSLMAQFAKNSFDEKQLLDFCKDVVKHRGDCYGKLT